MLVNKGHRFLFTVDTVLQLSPCHRLHMNSLRYSCYFLTIEQVATDHRPSVDQLTDTSVKYRRSIGEKSAKYRWTKSYTGRDTPGTTIDRVSNECRPTIVRVSTDYRPLYRPSLDRLSTECRPTIDRLLTAISTDYQPLCRPTDRSTLPTVNMIRCFLVQTSLFQALR